MTVYDKPLTYKLTHWGRHLAKLTGSQQDITRIFYNPDGSLPHSQEPVTCPYHQPVWSRLCLHHTSRRAILILSTHLYLAFPSELFPSDYPSKTLHTPLLSPYVLHAPPHLRFLDLITRVIVDIIKISELPAGWTLTNTPAGRASCCRVVLSNGRAEC